MHPVQRLLLFFAPFILGLFFPVLIALYSGSVIYPLLLPPVPQHPHTIPLTQADVVVGGLALYMLICLFLFWGWHCAECGESPQKRRDKED